MSIISSFHEYRHMNCTLIKFFPLLDKIIILFFFFNSKLIWLYALAMRQIDDKDRMKYSIPLILDLRRMHE